MRAHSDDIAWRVVTRLLWFGQPIRQVCDKRLGLGVSRHYVLDVLDRFHATGDVATHQGKGADPLTHNTLTRAEDCQIVQQMLAAPRVTLKEQCAQFVLDSGVIISYRAFCKAVHRLRFTRKKIHTVAYQCDMERANAWLAELLTFHSVGELGVLDETSKDVDVVKSGFGYSLRGVECSAQDTYLSHDNLRVSALCLYTVQDGFLDWAFTSGMYNKDYFLHVTTENFRDWRGVLRRPMLLDHVRPAQRKCCCILLDNASIHHSHEFVARMVGVRAVVRYIPPYCHHLSPLDNGAFGELVLFLRRRHNWVLQVGIQEALEGAFRELNADGGRLARSAFRRCRYM